MTTKTTAQILTDAADEIETNGLAIGVPYSRLRHCYCTIGAIAHAAGWNPGDAFMREPWDAVPEAVSFIGRAAGLTPLTLEGQFNPPVSLWSDHLGVAGDTATVVSTLRRAAELAATS